MNNQEFKELVRSGIDKTIKQGKQSINEESGFCMYSTKCGLSCVVGNMMPVLVKSSLQGFEGDVAALTEGSTESKGWIKSFTKKQIDFLAKLQDQHDSPTYFEGNIRSTWLEAFTKGANELYETL